MRFIRIGKASAFLRELYRYSEKNGSFETLQSCQFFNRSLFLYLILWS